jgi:chemotaxis protein MotB
MRLAFIPATGVALIALAGCVPQSQYDDLMNAYRAKEQQLLQMQNEFDTARANEDLLRKQLGEAMARLEGLKGSGSQAEIDALKKQISELIAQIGSTPLPSEVNQMIIDLVAMYPDVLEFDEKTGIVRFKSDVTFESGSAKLSSKANAVLVKFADILNTDVATNLEVRVVGHTDNVRISKPATLKEHPTNIHLSAHRAISVREALVKDGVGSNRFMVGGYGEYRPIAENTKKGNEANRRVELYLVNMPANSLRGASEETAPAVASPEKVVPSTSTSESNEK